MVYAWQADAGPFTGIRYRSRLGDEFVNWAIFETPEGTSPFAVGRDETIDADDPDYLTALELLDLRAG